MTIIYILLAANIIFSFVLFASLKKEQKRNRILQAFIAGLVRSVSDYVSTTDKTNMDEVPEQNTKLPIPYKKVIEAVEHELLKDVSVVSIKSHEEWLRESRQLFTGDKEGNDGFVFMNYDLFDDLLTHWRSDELMTEKEKTYLRDDIVVTKENIGELQGEIAIYKDLFAGELDRANFKKETVDTQLLMMFNHLKPKYREELKRELFKS